VRLLGGLRFLQGHARICEIGARILHVRVEEAAVEVFGDVVVVVHIPARGHPIVDLADLTHEPEP
jgi:hypothetical protein